MIAYRDEKIENAIAFFAFEHKKKTREPLYQTALYKYLAFFDFRSLKETGQPALGLSYTAMERGPVPDEIYKHKEYRKSDLYVFVASGDSVQIAPKKKPNLDYFSRYETELLNNLIFIFAQLWIKTSIMSDASHQEITAWKKAWGRAQNSPIEYLDTFPGDVFAKVDTGTATLAEEHFALFAAMHHAR